MVWIAVADFYALSRPEFALSLVPDHANALRRVVEQKLLTTADPAKEPGLPNLAQRAMISDPLSSVPLRVFGILAEANGDDARAQRLMELSAARSLRDLNTQIWLADGRLLSAEFPAAMKHIDVLLRVWPGFGETIFPVLGDLAADPASVDAVVATLQSNPPWRSRFLAALTVNRVDLSALSKFYAEMRTGAAPLTMDELRPYLDALIEQGDADTAYALWSEILPPETGDTPHHGDFEGQLTNSPFDWTILRVTGAQASVTSDDKGGHALRVQFYNTRVPFRHVSQIMMLDAGSHRLTGMVRAKNLDNARGLQWTLACLTTNERLGETERMNGTLPWVAFEVAFNIPDRADCHAQTLVLELAARIPAEQEISGEIWFDDMRIEPVQESTTVN